MLVDIAPGTAVTISRIRDADTSTWLALRQIELVLLPKVARQSLIYTLKKTGEPDRPHWLPACRTIHAWCRQKAADRYLVKLYACAVLWRVMTLS